MHGHYHYWKIYTDMVQCDVVDMDACHCIVWKASTYKAWENTHEFSRGKGTMIMLSKRKDKEPEFFKEGRQVLTLKVEKEFEKIALFEDPASVIEKG